VPLLSNYLVISIKAKWPIVVRMVKVDAKCVPERSEWVTVFCIAAVARSTMTSLVTQHCIECTHNHNEKLIRLLLTFSVVTVSKILLSVGFGRFCKKNRGFRFGFCLSRFPPVVNVVRLCDPLHIKPAAVRYIFLCITPVDSSKYPTACDWWRTNHHLYPTSHVLRNATCLAVCATDIRC